MKENEIENLVFAGGGLKGFIHIGVLQILEEKGILANCKRFCGASIGSFFALLLCIGIRVIDIERLFLCIDPKNIVSYHPENLVKLFDKLGCESTDSLKNILHIILEKKTNNPRITMKELYELTNKEVCFSVTNISKQCGEYFNYKTSPDLEVAEACLISMCIPFLFEPRKYQDSYYLDGGIANNFPIDYFQNSQENTIGVSIQDSRITEPLPLPSDVISLFLNMYKTTLTQRTIDKHELYQNVICVINDYSPYEFDIPMSIKMGFIKSGRDSAIKFLKTHVEREIDIWATNYISKIITDVLEL